MRWMWRSIVSSMSPPTSAERSTRRRERNRAAQRVSLGGHHPAPAPQDLLVVQLDPPQPLAAEARVPDQRRGQRAFRVDPLRRGQQSDAPELLVGQRPAGLVGQVAQERHIASTLRGPERERLRRVDPQDLRELERRVARLVALAPEIGVEVDVPRVARHSEWITSCIGNRTAWRRGFRDAVASARRLLARTRRGRPPAPATGAR